MIGWGCAGPSGEPWTGMMGSPSLVMISSRGGAGAGGAVGRAAATGAGGGALGAGWTSSACSSGGRTNSDRLARCTTQARIAQAAIPARTNGSLDGRVLPWFKVRRRSLLVTW